MKCQDLGWNRHFQVQHVSKSVEGITDLPSVFLPSKKPTEKPCRLQSCFPFLELRPSGSNTSTRVRQHRSDMVRQQAAESDKKQLTECKHERVRRNAMFMVSFLGSILGERALLCRHPPALCLVSRHRNVRDKNGGISWLFTS